MDEWQLPALLGTDGNKMGSQKSGLNSPNVTTFGSWIGQESSNAGDARPAELRLQSGREQPGPQLFQTDRVISTAGLNCQLVFTCEPADGHKEKALRRVHLIH